MEFSTDIFTLEAPTTRKFPLNGLKMPVSKDYYFRAKQQELIDQYAAARIFMHETDTDNWEHWFTRPEDETNMVAFQNIFRSYFYETALLYYNIVVDLSWTLCYVCAEFAIHKGENVFDFSGLMPIEEASRLLRDAEKMISNPDSENNPFQYLKKMAPEYTAAIDMVVDFWNVFGDSMIRRKYNFCKHRGKPAYTEIERQRNGRFMNFFVKSSSGTLTQMTSDIRDVRWELSLKDSIEELRGFDDEQLFPYIQELMHELERVLEPSPMV